MSSTASSDRAPRTAFDLRSAPSHLILHMLSWAGERGLMARFTGMVEDCMSDYDLEGFTAAPWADA